MLEKINTLENQEFFDELIKCCGSKNWAIKLIEKRPFKNKEDLFLKSDEAWSFSNENDAMEAFSHHPKIGDIKSLEKKFASTKEWAGKEQSGVNTANQETLVALANGNELYEKKFGFIFIVCATGKTAKEMLEILNSRINNNPQQELKNAMDEQNKITKIRLEKLIS